MIQKQREEDMEKSKFKINGQPLRFGNRHTLVRFLDKLPFGEVVTTREVSLKTGISHMDGSFRHPDLLVRSAKHNNIRLWGNKKTIQELNKQLAQG